MTIPQAEPSGNTIRTHVESLHGHGTRQEP